MSWPRSVERTAYDNAVKLFEAAWSIQKLRPNSNDFISPLINGECIRATLGTDKLTSYVIQRSLTVGWDGAIAIFNEANLGTESRPNYLLTKPGRVEVPRLRELAHSPVYLQRYDQTKLTESLAWASLIMFDQQL